MTSAPQNKHKYGCKRDTPDASDKLYCLQPHLYTANVPLPVTVDLRPQCPPVYDQGQLGSCTANAGSCAVQFDMMDQKENVETPSRLFLYYNERVMDGDVKEDGGSSLRTCIKSINTSGVCGETLCPYVASNFAVKPSTAAYTEAKTHKGVLSYRVNQTLYDLQHCVFSGRPFIFGFTVFESFESQAVAQTGTMPMPAQGEQQLGGHAVTCVGYKPGYFIVRNSWGADWGDKGYFYMPEAFMLNASLCNDFWCLQSIK